MACEIVEMSGGLFTAKISGKLKKSELDQVQKAAIKFMETGGKARFLIIAEAFQGWDNKADWGDVSFQMKYDAQIERIAIVGEKRWEDLTSAFVGQGIRPVDIRYFQPADLAIARTWIAQKP
jgi:hypothetical protein